MGSTGYFVSEAERLERERQLQDIRDQVAARIADLRHQLAAKIVMAVVDRIVGDIIRPGPKPEERECYVMAGELRALSPELEALAKAIIDVNNGCK